MSSVRQTIGRVRMGLGDDARLLAEVYAAGGAALCREITEDLVTQSSGQSRSSDRYGEVDIELHGLGLDSGDEEELGDRMWMLVAERIAWARWAWPWTVLGLVRDYDESVDHDRCGK
jgi:hypothetical protein